MSQRVLTVLTHGLYIAALIVIWYAEIGWRNNANEWHDVALKLRALDIEHQVLLKMADKGLHQCADNTRVCISMLPVEQRKSFVGQ